MAIFATTALLQPDGSFLTEPDDLPGQFPGGTNDPTTQEPDGSTTAPGTTPPPVDGGSTGSPGTSAGGGPTPPRTQGTGGENRDITGQAVADSVAQLIPLALAGAALWFIMQRN